MTVNMLFSININTLKLVGGTKPSEHADSATLFGYMIKSGNMMENHNEYGKEELLFPCQTQTQS